VRPRAPVGAIVLCACAFILLAPAHNFGQTPSSARDPTGDSYPVEGRLPDYRGQTGSPGSELLSGLAPILDLGPDRPAFERRAEELLFVFATIADSHIKRYRYDDYRYLKALSISRELLANCVEDINNHMPPVDFVIHLGDITDFGDVSDFNHARTVLEALECPLYPVVGNHDNFRSDNKAAWKEFAGRDSTNYTFDHHGLHFVVIDCTPNPYDPANIECDSILRNWVAEDLARNSGRPAVILSHYNMWERGWNAMFDTTSHYAEYRGMPELRQVLEQAGNVVAVINGHVHANRVEVHNGIYYIDIGATLVGRPSVRYFQVYMTRIAVTSEYISDSQLSEHVENLGLECCCCFDRFEVCDYVDGSEADKAFMIPTGRLLSVGTHVRDPSFPMVLTLRHRGGRRITAAMSSGIVGTLEISLFDVQGRLLDRCTVRKGRPVWVADLSGELCAITQLPNGVYFVRARQGQYSRCAKLILAD
jgi:predicted phosphodiesterase